MASGTGRALVAGAVFLGLFGIASGAATLHASAGDLADRYIVTFDGTATAGDVATTMAAARRSGGSVDLTYRSAVRGFAATMPASALDALQSDPHVASVERDRAVHVSGDVQTPAPWDLDQLDQSASAPDGTYSYNSTGTGVTAYVIDTGIRATHHQFGGRVGAGFSTIHDGRGTGDCAGHGTHVAGTIGGATYGVAKNVRLVPVRVLDCSGRGTVADLIAGVDWVTAHHRGPSVANLSLGTDVSPALDRAVNRSIASGVTYVVAAGNSAGSACASSPGRVPAAVTVGATTRGDRRADYSNFGRCVDIFAPGSGIRSAAPTSDTATAVMSGTSMAAPHVTGVIATYLQDRPNAGPARVRRALRDAALIDTLVAIGPGSPNALLHALS